MTRPIKYDKDMFLEIKIHAQDLKSTHTQRDIDFERYKQAYLLQWPPEKIKRMKRLRQTATLSPDAYNDVNGAVRLMISTDPQFNIVNLTTMEKVTGQIETSLNRIWEQSGRVSGMPTHYDMLLSAVLFSEMHTAVTLTSDLVTSAEKAASRAEKKNLAYAKAQIRRMEFLAEHTPGMIENWSPVTGYPEFDNFGFLTTYYRQSTVRHADIIRRFGVELSSTSQRGLSAPAVLESYWDDVYSWYWVGNEVLYFGEHKLPRLPINVQISDGSRLFEKPEEQRMPLLYGFIKSGMFDNQSLAYSILFNLVFAMGATPIIKHRHNGDGKKADTITNFDVDGGAWEVGPGEDIEFMQKNIIDPSLREGLALATQKGQESTIYPQAFGAPVEGNDTYSALALLNSSGRLPLIGPQKRGAWGISNTIELLLTMMREDGKSYKSNGIDIDLSLIPEHIQVETKLEVDLPQDKLQLANMASMLKKAGLASDEWIQTNLMQINDPHAMRKQVLRERVQEALATQRIQEKIEELQARRNSQLPPGGAPQTGKPGQIAAPTSPNTGTSMTAGPMMPEDGETLRGMPQVMAGMMPGVGRAVAPPQGQANGKPPKARMR